MKIYRNLRHLLLILSSVVMMQCESTYTDTDFGFNSSISGIVKDAGGNTIFGDATANVILIKLLGEGDKQTVDIRVLGDGTFQNTKLYPQNYTITIEGPIVKFDPTSVDLSDGTGKNVDLTVTPLVSPKIINGTTSGTSIDVQYSIVPAAGYTVKKKEIYCSTATYPTASTGSLTNIYSTKTVALPSELSGTVKITGLVSGTKYYLRIGAQSSSTATSLFNYSNQIEITTQ